MKKKIFILNTLPDLNYYDTYLSYVSFYSTNPIVCIEETAKDNYTTFEISLNENKTLISYSFFEKVKNEINKKSIPICHYKYFLEDGLTLEIFFISYLNKLFIEIPFLDELKLSDFSFPLSDYIVEECGDNETILSILADEWIKLSKENIL